MSTPTVRDLMTEEVFTLERNDELTIADDLMKQKRIRHIPVLDEEGRVAGILTQRDLFRGALVRALGFGSNAEEQMLHSLVVKEVMTTEPKTVAPDVLLAEAAQRMVDEQVGCLIVMENDEMIGILTEGDFVRLAAAAAWGVERPPTD